jgi:hypothetical protein
MARGWVCEFRCADRKCRHRFELGSAAICDLSEQTPLRCPNCTFGVNLHAWEHLWGLRMLLNRIIPNLHDWEPDMRLEGFVTNLSGYCSAAVIACLRCGRLIEFAYDRSQSIARCGSMLQCPDCGPIRRGRMRAREFFQFFPTVYLAQRFLSGSGWRMRLVLSDKAPPPKMLPPEQLAALEKLEGERKERRIAARRRRTKK